MPWTTTFFEVPSFKLHKTSSVSFFTSTTSSCPNPTVYKGFNSNASSRPSMVTLVQDSLIPYSFITQILVSSGSNVHRWPPIATRRCLTHKSPGILPTKLGSGSW
uniref:Uncharacterized protein n=1 Tax=Opuntia streptacantha TaxID=393608 RepID=A0A7C9FIG1_OPUST